MNAILEKLEAEIQKRKISEEEAADTLSASPQVSNRRIISGYASVAIADREGHLITIPALKEAVNRFMQDGNYRPVQVFHSDIQLGRILPKWTDPNTGKVHKTEVDNTGWRVVVEIRDDVDIADKVWDEIQKGNLRSFSIAGTAKPGSKEDKYENGKHYTAINALDIFECTICEIPVNQMSTFSILYDPNKVSI